MLAYFYQNSLKTLNLFFSQSFHGEVVKSVSLPNLTEASHKKCCFTKFNNVRLAITPHFPNEAGPVLEIENDQFILEAIIRGWTHIVTFCGAVPDLMHVQLVADVLQVLGLHYVEV